MRRPAFWLAAFALAAMLGGTARAHAGAGNAYGKTVDNVLAAKAAALPSNARLHVVV